MDQGVFASTDGGATWLDATLPLGMPKVECTAIEAMDRPPSGTGFLNVATFGRGMWRIQLPQASAPNLKLSVVLKRNGNAINAEATIINTGGTANNVRITAASLKPDIGTAVNTTTRLPINVGTLGTNGIVVNTLNFPSSVGRSGTAATFNVTCTYAGGTLTATARTRLP